jgi:type IV secretory pathway VirB2 component (pilin)
MPSRWRRLLIVLVYLLAATVVVSVTASQLISSQCSSDDLCTPAEQIAQAVLGWAWFLAVVLIAVLGLRGRLWGARRKPLLR